MNGDTLRHRLLRFILIPLLISLIAAGSVSFIAARKETSEIYDKQLVLLAQVLRSITAKDDDDEENYIRRIDRYETIFEGSGEQSFSYRIWIDGRAVLTSPNARGFRSTVAASGFSDQEFGGQMWRVFVLEDKNNGIVVEVAGREELRTDIIQEILLFMFIPLLLIVPVIAALVWFGVIRGLKPISVLSNLITARDPNNLSPFTADEMPRGDVPGEIIPLVDALNSLMMRMGNVLESEKMFTDHAAHELRTPLATIKIQAQVALRTADSGEKQQMLGDLVKGVDRAGHLVSQLLCLARAQSQQAELAPVNLSTLVNRMAGEFAHQVSARRQTMDMDIAPDVEIAGIEELLDVLLRNLIDNAVKYTPHAGTIYLRLTRQGGNAVFGIENSGPGIPQKDREHIFEHFFRLPGHTETGSGLGLALAKKVCEIHNATIELVPSDNNTVTCFVVRFACPDT